MSVVSTPNGHLEIFPSAGDELEVILSTTAVTYQTHASLSDFSIAIIRMVCFFGEKNENEIIIGSQDCEALLTCVVIKVAPILWEIDKRRRDLANFTRISFFVHTQDPPRKIITGESVLRAKRAASEAFLTAAFGLGKGISVVDFGTKAEREAFEFDGDQNGGTTDETSLTTLVVVLVCSGVIIMGLLGIVIWMKRSSRKNQLLGSEIKNDENRWVNVQGKTLVNTLREATSASELGPSISQLLTDHDIISSWSSSRENQDRHWDAVEKQLKLIALEEKLKDTSPSRMTGALSPISMGDDRYLDIRDTPSRLSAVAPEPGHSAFNRHAPQVPLPMLVTDERDFMNIRNIPSRLSADTHAVHPDVVLNSAVENDIAIMKKMQDLCDDELKSGKAAHFYPEDNSSNIRYY